MQIFPKNLYNLINLLLKMVLNTLAEQLNISPELLIILIIWTFIWKGLALWKSSRSNQPIWFVLLLIINTFGILEIIYLILYSKHSVSITPKNNTKQKTRK